MSSLYDLLGVRPSASVDEIRAAWRAKIADLDPGDKRFGLLNDAAGVLLDPDKKSAYDESLAPEPEPELAPEPARTDQPPAPQPVREAPEGAPAETGGVPSWLLAVLASLTAIVSLGALALAVLVPSSGAMERATSEAEQTAQRAVTTVFSYDYRTLDADQANAVAYLTADYRTKYDELFGLIKENAPRLKLKVEAEFIASGLVRSGGDSGGWLGLGQHSADRVQVLVMFDQKKLSGASTTPVRFRNFATLTMVKVGDDWLIDGIAGPPPVQ